MLLKNYKNLETKFMHKIHYATMITKIYFANKLFIYSHIFSYMLCYTLLAFSGALCTYLFKQEAFLPHMRYVLQAYVQ